MSILKDNIQASVYLSDAFSSALGPKGMNKLLVDNLGDTYVTNNGATIVESVEISHPIAKLVAETAKTMEQEIGDGSKTAVLITGELLKQATGLLEKGLHPMIIIKGYKKALIDSLALLESKAIRRVGEKEMKDLAKTALRNQDHLVKTILEALKETETKDIRIVKKTGKGVEDTRVINGVIIDKEKAHPGMPSLVKNAKVLITRTPIEARTTQTSSEIIIDRPDQLTEFLEREDKTLRTIINSISKSGANVILCQKGISDTAQEMLVRKGILAIRRIREKDINDLLKLTRARIVNELTSIDKSNLGNASVNTKKIKSERLTFITGKGSIKTIIVRGSTKQLIDEQEKAIKSALGVINTIQKEKAFVPGAGAIESILHDELIKNSFKGKESLAYKAFAKSLLIITKTLLTNAGKKAINLLPTKNKGVSAEGELINALNNGIIEPLNLKKQAILSATETAVMILRINDLLIAK